jgi:hypothetical protein
MLNGRTRFILLFLVFLEVFLVTTSYTDADLSAERIVLQNKFTTITINFFSQNTANNNPLTTLLRTSSMQPGGFDVGAIRVRNGVQKDLKYSLKTVKVNGDDTFCRALTLRTFHRDLSVKYDGSLMDYTVSSTLSDTVPEDWILLIGLDDAGEQLKNKSCEFNFVMRTYRDSPDETGGIFAERKVNNIISSGTW